MSEPRERLQRAFRKRLRGAQPKPPLTVGVVKVLNAPFTLRLLSAIILTIGGSYFAGHQKCEGEANRLITDYYRDQIELMRRFEYIRAGVAKAKSLHDVAETLKTQPNVYVDFKNRTTRDLDLEVLRMERVIDFSKDREGIKYFKRMFGRNDPPFRISPEGSIAEGDEDLTGLTEDDLERAKQFVAVFISDALSTLAAHNQIHLWPNCGFANSLLGIQARGPRKFIEADTSIPRSGN